MTSTDYDTAMARARSALAVLNRAAAELSRADREPDVDTVLRHLRSDLRRSDASAPAGSPMG
jgi:hypothetical protein